MNDAKVSDCPQCNAKRTSLTCDQCGLTLRGMVDESNEIARLRDINKGLLEALRTISRMDDGTDEWVAAKHHSLWEIATEMGKVANDAIAKAEGR